VEPMVETGGDCYARCLVRIRETFHSIDLIRQAAGKMPDGPIDLRVKGTPNRAATRLDNADHRHAQELSQSWQSHCRDGIAGNHDDLYVLVEQKKGALQGVSR
jgi:NADH:ubiquinone oxidoreductase subunit D